MLQKKSMPRGIIIFIVLCVSLVLLAGGMLAVSRYRAPDVTPLFDSEKYYQTYYRDTEAPLPGPLLMKPEPEAPRETESAPAAAPVDLILEKAPECIITSIPVRMRIPALALDYAVQGTGADEKGTMQIVPALEIISWFRLSAIPGNRGNAIFGGHNTWSGVRSPIFTLDQLEVGDEMIIDYADGTSLNFRLESVFVYLLRTAPADLIMDVRGEARVTLITCKWPFNTVTGTSDYRIVAIFKEEHVFTVPDPPIEPFPPRVLD